MAIWKSIKGLDAKFAWSFTGVVIGVMSLLAATYLALRNPKTEVTFDIIGESNVLDVHEPISGLEITFNGDTIRNKGLNLLVTTVRLSNTGEVNIRQGDYDEIAGWGLTLDSGKIISASIVDASSDYLRNAVSKIDVSERTMGFPRVIFDTGQSFAVSLLILHPVTSRPSVTSFGKIAGMQTFRMLTSWRNKGDSALVAAFAGRVNVQVIRFIAYGVVFVLVVIAVLFVGDKVSTMRQRRRRAARESAIEKLQETAGTVSGFNVIADTFVSSGIQGLHWLRDMLTSPDFIEAVKTTQNDLQPIDERDVAIRRAAAVNGNLVLTPNMFYGIEYGNGFIHVSPEIIIKSLLEQNCIVVVDSTRVTIAKEFSAILNIAIDQLTS